MESSNKYRVMLTQLKKVQKHNRFIGFDTETKGKQNKFVCGSLVNDERQEFFTDRDEMREYILKSRWLQKYKIVATNLEFDVNAIFNIDDSNLKRLYRGKLLSAKALASGKRNYINFWDTLSFLPCSVKKLGDTIGIPKLKEPKCFKRQPKNDEEMQELKTYNINDSYISFKFMQELQQSINELGGNMKMTIASTTMDVFRRQYLKGIHLQPSEKIIKDMYKSYYGGRTEVIRRGLFKKVNYYDFNSLYPSVMLGNEFPDINSIKVAHKLFINKEGFCKVKLKVPDIHIPLLPLKTDKLIFPCGTISGWYNHNELKEAIRLGYKVLRFYKGYYFSDTQPLFNEFVEDLYEKRMMYKKDKNDVMQMSCKLLLNSLYGKFAQKTDKDETIITEKDLTVDILDKCDVVEIKKGIYRVIKNVKPRYSSFIIPIWSSYITSFARMKLYNALPKDTIYMDTDSIITKHDYEDSNVLGELKKEHTLKNVLVVKPKMYYYENSDGYEFIKLKGVGRVNKEKFKQILKGEPVAIERFAKWKESIRRGLIPNEQINFYKNINLEDNKRDWNKKFNIEPQCSKPLIIA